MIVLELLTDVDGLAAAGGWVVAVRGQAPEHGRFVVVEQGDGYGLARWDGQGAYVAVVRSVIQ